MEAKKTDSPPRKTLRGLPLNGEAFFSKEKEESAKATASQLKRKGVGVYKTRTTDNGIYIKRLQ